MEPDAQVLGVHPVAATPEPCHLVEMLFRGYDACRWEQVDVTQEQPGQPPPNWQVAYDVRVLEQEEGQTRVAFFFHYLDLSRPLRTPVGAAGLPAPTPVPPHLQAVEREYEPPD